MSSLLVRFYVGASPGDAIVSADQHAVRASRAASVLAFLGVDGATILPAVGVWRGDTEASMVVEIILPTVDTVLVRRLADELRAAFAQNAVLVVSHPVASFLAEKAALPVVDEEAFS